jgi:hypothetical protein
MSGRNASDSTADTAPVGPWAPRPISSRDLTPSLAASAAAGPDPCVLLVEPLLLEVLDAPLLLLLDVLLELPELLLLDALLEVLLLVLPVDVPMVAVVVPAAGEPDPLLETSTPPQPLSAAPTTKIPSSALGQIKFDIKWTLPCRVVSRDVMPAKAHWRKASQRGDLSRFGVGTQ